MVYYKKELTSASDKQFLDKRTFYSMMSLWLLTEPVISELDGNNLKYTSCYAVCNPSLLTAFTLEKQKLEARLQEDPVFFSSRSYLLTEGADQHRWVFSEFEKKAAACSWNSLHDVQILPGVQGTTAAVAWKLAANGFTYVSSLDDGLYGKGNYFSSSIEHVQPYVDSFSKLTKQVLSI